MTDPIEAAATDVVARILLDLSDRRGVGHELAAIDDDVREEMINSLRAEARAAIAAYRDSEIEALRGQVAETRKILAHTVMGSPPNDWPLKDVAEARLHDMIGLRNQVRDTCVRAEQAEAKHADCQAVIRHKGHDADCPARACSFVGFTSRCSQSPAWHKVVKVGHEYQSPPCSDACGHDRTTGEKA